MPLSDALFNLIEVLATSRELEGEEREKFLNEKIEKLYEDAIRARYGDNVSAD